MTSRRHYLTLLAAGSIGLAGCGGNTTSSTPTDSRSRTTSTPAATETEVGTEAGTEVEEEETGTPSVEERVNQQLRESIPLDGLGMYEEKIVEADVPDSATVDEIDAILEGNTDPETLRNGLDDIITTDNIHSVMRYFHQQHTDQENTIVANKNWSFTSQSEPIAEIYTVQNGQLQSGPTINDSHNNTIDATNQPGSQTPEYLADLRNPQDWAQMLPTDYQALQEQMEFARDYDNATDEDIRGIREYTFEKMSYAVPGIEDENFMLYDGESANLVTDARRQGNPEAAQALTSLANELPEAEGYGEEVLTTAEYTGSGWEFRTHPDYEPGDPLPGEQ